LPVFLCRKREDLEQKGWLRLWLREIEVGAVSHENLVNSKVKRMSGEYVLEPGMGVYVFALLFYNGGQLFQIFSEVRLTVDDSGVIVK
jgi:hypothetical protein